MMQYNLTPGIHTVIVTDAKDIATDTVTITEPTELTIAIQDTSTVYSYCTGTNSASYTRCIWRYRTL